MTTQTKKTKAIWALDPTHSSVEFSARHLVISTVRGRFGKFDIDASFNEEQPEKSRVNARIDTRSLETKDAQRDTHLKSPDLLDVEKFPEITFSTKGVEQRGKDRYALVGDLTIRGVSKEVALDTTFSGIIKDPWGNRRAGFSAEATVNRKDFGLVWNIALETGGWVVGDHIKVSIDTEFVLQQPKPA